MFNKKGFSKLELLITLSVTIIIGGILYGCMEPSAERDQTLKNKCYS